MELKSLKVRKVEATLLREAGSYVATIVNFEFINSHEKNFMHELKAGLKEAIEAGEMWCDPTPQIAITFGDKTGKGVITHRFNACGYLHADDAEVTDKMLQRNDILVIGNYVCQQTKDGYKRIESEEKTESALRMLFSFINKLGITNEELDVEEALNTAKADQYNIVIDVAEDEYNGKTRMVIEKFHRAKLEDLEPVEDDVTDDDLN